jgi:hypothetical protein
VGAALAATQKTATTPEDAALAQRIVEDYRSYRETLGLDRLPPTQKMSSRDVVEWSDAHHMRDLLVPCIELADRQRERMQGSLERSESQTAWAGRVLFCLGFAGVLAGLLSGYATARALMRRVARLSIRVQAVQAHLDQEVGAMTVQGPAHFGDLDKQLDLVVGRVSAVCQRLQVHAKNKSGGKPWKLNTAREGVCYKTRPNTSVQSAVALVADRLQYHRNVSRVALPNRYQ